PVRAAGRQADAGVRLRDGARAPARRSGVRVRRGRARRVPGEPGRGRGPLRVPGRRVAARRRLQRAAARGRRQLQVADEARRRERRLGRGHRRRRRGARGRGDGQAAAGGARAVARAARRGRRGRGRTAVRGRKRRENEREMSAYDLEEQEQLAELKAWWKTHGNTVLSAAIAALLAVAAWNGWTWYQRTQAAQAGALYDTLQKAARANDVKATRDAAGAILENHPRTTYALLAALTSAKVHFQAG